MSNFRDNTKTVVGWLAGAGAAAATSNLLRANRNTSDKAVVDVYYDTTAVVGGLVVGAMAKDAARAYADTYVDRLFDEVIEMKKTILSINDKTEN